ncbi:SCO7613 C-terminal domain-containing membrane protein [Streptomyces fructofermentans]|uniref:SCO7613 C-terminal domain-containing membrane protein n=1 Tax=Streptomyces fructofermentans TaxID=152141 RepID=UPI0037B24A45
MTNIPPPAEELRLLDHELRQLDARRSQLLVRRAWLLGVLQAAAVPAAPAPRGRRPEAGAPGVQNVLLVLGGVLLTVAAVAFTLVSWGHLGITGRALVLGAVTAAALAVPVPLLARGLRSTAESVAGLGLALTALDAYALHEVAFPEVDGTAYAAAATALLAVLWGAYGISSGALRLPLPAATAAAQLPLLLWVAAADAGEHTITAALLVTAAFDTVVALRVSARSVRVVASVGAYGAGALGALAAGLLSWDAAGPSAAARAAALLLLAAAVATAASWAGSERGAAPWLALTGGLLTVAAAGGVLRAALPGAWTVPACLAVGVALLAARSERLPTAVRRGLRWASGAVQALAVVWALPLVTVVVLGPAAWVARVWSGAPADAREAAVAAGSWPTGTETGPLVLAAVAAVLVLSSRGAPYRAWALGGAAAAVWTAVLAVPATLELPYAAALSAEGVLVAAALASAVYASVSRAGRAPEAERAGGEGGASSPGGGRVPFLLALPRGAAVLAATATAVATSVHLAVLALAAETPTLVVLAVLTVLFATAGVLLGDEPRAITAAASFAYAAALACASGGSLGLAPHHTALLVLAVPVAAALLAARLGDGTPGRAVEVTGAAAALPAVGLAVQDPPVLALVLALCGVIAAGTAVRPDRRWAGHAAAALFVLAAWVRLASWEVGAPEAYTLPVTVPALVVGFVRRRRDGRASSWTAYGPGLSVTLVPSLLAAWGDPHWLRPLLLGAGALAVTLVGVRHRLRAPIVIGGGVLVLVALHELAPYIAQVAGALPRWVPPALAGLLLLALGATYEQRLRDARRVRDVLGRMN